jgi:ATP-binding cassette subfamily F protein 3
LDEYAAWLRSRPAADAALPTAPIAAPAPVAKPKTARVNPHKLAKAEARVAELEAELVTIEKSLADPALYADGGARAAELGRRQTELRGELEAAESELLQLYEAAA